MEVISRQLANTIEEARGVCNNKPFEMIRYMQSIDSPYISHENYNYIIRIIQGGYVVSGEYHKHSSSDIYESFWKRIVENEDGTINMEALQNELADYLQLIDNVPKVYDELAGFSKPHTDPQVIIKAVHERFIDRQDAFDDLKMIATPAYAVDGDEKFLQFTEEELRDYFDIEEESK
jgi:hypothetical protein